MNRTVLITGATGKFGRVLVRHFLESGDCVIAAGRSIKSLQDLKENCSQWERQLHLLVIDFMVDQVEIHFLEKIKKLGVEPDCLINNARSLESLKLDRDGKASSRNFIDELKLGVVVPYELTMALANSSSSQLRAVVNIGSIYGAVVPNLSLYSNSIQQSPIHYGVTKAALVHLTKELAVRLASRNIRVNCAAFGGVEGRADDEFKKRYASLCPAGRMLSEREISGPVEMLLSESASGITGHVLMVDGGWSLW